MQSADARYFTSEARRAFEATGAALTTTNTLKHALILVEHDGLSGAILDHALGDGNSSLLCQRLKERGIPFIIYSGYDRVGGPCLDAVHISKPAADGALVTAMEGLIRDATAPQTELTPLLAQQRQIGDQYRVAEKAIHELLSLMDGNEPTIRAEIEADVADRTAASVRLGQRLLELDASVTEATSR